MVSYMHNPQFKVTVGTTDYVNQWVSNCKVIRVENGFDTATVTFSETKSELRGTVINGASITIYVKDSSETNYTTIFKGIIRFVTESYPPEMITVKCDGAGYGLGDTLCDTEYGEQSSNWLLEHIDEILTDASDGIIPRYVNHVFNATVDTNTGFAYTSSVEVIDGHIPYLYGGYKPNSKVIQDVCDILTAIKAGAAGPHWIVDTNNVFRCRTIGNNDDTNWLKYVAKILADATIVQGIDFTTFDFQTLTAEANYILYYGHWRKPASGDMWTENQHALWTADIGNVDIDDEGGAGLHPAGDYSLILTDTVGAGDIVYYPVGKNASWDFSYFDYPENIPSLNFHMRRSGATGGISVSLEHTYGVDQWVYNTIDTDLTLANEWYHFSLPVGPCFNRGEWTTGGGKWTKVGAPDWSDINCISFTYTSAAHNPIYIDGLHFGGAVVCRVARSRYLGEGGTLGTSSNPVKMKVVTDEMGKDDSLDATIATGTMAQLAYAELLRCRGTPTIGSLNTSMIKEALPGQFLHVHAKPNSIGTYQIDKDFRITSLTHSFASQEGYVTTFQLTDDVYNHTARKRYSDLNTIFASARPEFQDRQASSIKGGQIDTRITRLEKDYA